MIHPVLDISWMPIKADILVLLLGLGVLKLLVLITRIARIGEKKPILWPLNQLAHLWSRGEGEAVERRLTMMSED